MISLFNASEFSTEVVGIKISRSMEAFCLGPSLSWVGYTTWRAKQMAKGSCYQTCVFYLSHVNRGTLVYVSRLLKTVELGSGRRKNRKGGRGVYQFPHHYHVLGWNSKEPEPINLNLPSKRPSDQIRRTMNTLDLSA
jgi:hypothetical protein